MIIQTSNYEDYPYIYITNPKVMFGIYCRISREKEEGKDRSINDQKLLGIELAESLDIPYKAYIDEGISGTSEIEDRPEFSNMLDDITNGALTHVYSFDQSRLERNPQVRFALKKLLKENNIQLFTDTGEVDLDDDEMEMLGDIVSIMNSYYVRITKKKIKSVIKRNISEGKVHGLTTYGYTKDKNGYMVIHEEESKIIKRIFKLALDGMGYRTIARLLNEEGIPTRQNILGKGTYNTTNNFTGEITTKNRSESKWSNSTISGILNNRIYKGIRKVSGVTYESPVIISPSLWKQSHDKIKVNNTRTGKNTSHNYLLNNILICGKCGRRITGRKKHGDYVYYRCVGKEYPQNKCKSRGISQPVLEWLIWNRLFLSNDLISKVQDWSKNTDTPLKIKEIQQKITIKEKEIKDIAKRRANAVSMVLDGTLSKDDVKLELTKMDRLKKDDEILLVNLNDELKSYEKSNTYLAILKGDMNSIKNNITFNQKKEIIKKWIKTVEIDYAADLANSRKYYGITVDFNLPDMSINVFVMDTKYKKAKELGYPNEYIPPTDFTGWYMDDLD